jgi:hypothetical protein
MPVRQLRDRRLYRPSDGYVTRVNASNQSITARRANSIHKGFQQPIVGAISAPEERRILGKIKGNAALEEKSSSYVPAGSEPNDASPGIAGGVYRALDRDGIKNDSIAHRLKGSHGEAPPRRLGETEWNLHHRGGRSNMSKHTATCPSRSAGTISSNCQQSPQRMLSHLFLNGAAYQVAPRFLNQPTAA